LVGGKFKPRTGERSSGMKEEELRELSDCIICKKGIGHTGLPLFTKLTIERFGLNKSALKRHTGLEMMISPGLASVMGPNEDLADRLGDSIVVAVCESCLTENVCIAQLMEPVETSDAGGQDG